VPPDPLAASAKPSNVFGRLAAWALAHRTVCGLALVAFVAVSCVGALRLRFDFSSATFYGDDSARLATWKAFQTRFGPDDRSLAIVAQRDAQGGVITREAFATLDRLADELAADPEVREVHTLGRIRPLPGGPTVAAIAEQLGGSLLLSDPRAVPLWLSEDGRTTLVVVELATTSDDLFTTAATMTRIEGILAEFGESTELRLDLAGLPAVRAAFFHLTLHDQQRLVPLALGIVGLGLFLTMRNLGLVVVTGLSAAIPMIGLVGLMGWLGEPIGLLNQAYFTLLPVIIVADVLHLTLGAQREAGAGNLAWPDAIVRTASRVGWACVLSTVTTGVGFASLSLASMPILRSFGLYAAAAMLLALATLLVLTPWMLSFMDSPPRSATATPASHEGGLAATLGEFALARPHLVLVCTGLVTAISVGWAARVVVDNRLSDLLLPSHPVALANARLDEVLGGSLSLELELQATPEYWRQPQGEALLDGWAAWARAQPEIRAVITPRERAAWFAPDGTARLSFRLGDLGARAFLALEAEAWDRHAQQRDPVETRITGTTALAYHGVSQISLELRKSLWLALVTVSALIGVLFRSPRLALLSVIPNTVPVLLGYGLLGPAGIPLDPLAAVILVVVLGLAVDDTIHLLAGLQHAATRPGGPTSVVAAMQESLRSSGKAVTVSSLVLAVGLSVNLLSSFPPLRLLGGWGALLILLAWLGDVLVLPALLRLCLRSAWHHTHTVGDRRASGDLELDPREPRG